MTDVLVIAGEPTWPPVSGGRVRVAGLVHALARQLSVAVVEPYWPGDDPSPHPSTPADIRRIAVPVADRPGSLRHFADWRPRLGLDVLDSAGRRRLPRIVENVAPRALFYCQSYLAGAAPSLELPSIVDFQNIESERLRSIAAHAHGIHRASAVWEGVKARAWEPRVARRCTFAVAVSPADAAVIAGWGGDAVVVPNALPNVEPCCPSPDNGAVLFVANVRYEPNEQAAVRLIEGIWPRVRAKAPEAELCVVGTETDRRLGHLQGKGVRVVGQVPELRPYYESAAIVVAPVESGGGTQLKVMEALAHGRVVVGTSYSARSVPPEAKEGFVAANDDLELVASIAGLLQDPGARHRREAELIASIADVTGWDLASRPLLERLRGLLGRT